MPESQGSNATPETKIISENRREKKRKRDVIDRMVSKVFSENRKKKFAFSIIGGGVCVKRNKEGLVLCAAVYGKNHGPSLIGR